MQHYISKENHIFTFSPHHSPALTVSSGDSIIFETMDCFSDQIQSAGDLLEEVSFDRVNPATGPVYVEGAQKGDTLKVKINRVEVGEQAVMLTGKGLGVLGNKLEGMYLKTLPVEKGYVVFDEKTKLPLKPMVGVIGVAPESGEINCGTPHDHGGNMDTTLIREGAEVFLPVRAEGALLALGDLHAAMGDGEVSVSGAEVPGKVEVTVTLIKELVIPTPLLINDQILAVIYSHETLDQAVESAVEVMVELIENRTALPREEIIMLLSVGGQVAISQVVDPLKTARCEIALDILENYNFKLY